MGEFKTAKEVLAGSQFPQLSLQEVLATYDNITLTDDEITEAMIAAKRKKEESIRMQNLRDKERFNRENASNLMNMDVIRTFMMRRAADLFQGRFIIDEENENLFTLLCMYFTNDPGFCDFAEKMGTKGASLSKGLLIAGNFGIGKTWMMKLFMKNARQVYYLRNAKEISDSFLQAGDNQIPKEYLEPFKTAVNDASVFYQAIAGLCIDDIGTENVKNSYGNKSNVIGDVIEMRYAERSDDYPNGYTGILLHGTTNLSAEDMRDYYGERVVSRMREIFNYIKPGGNDRRK